MEAGKTGRVWVEYCIAVQAVATGVVALIAMGPAPTDIGTGRAAEHARVGSGDFGEVVRPGEAKRSVRLPPGYYKHKHTNTHAHTHTHKNVKI